VRQEGRLVAAAFSAQGFRQAAREQVGGVGFQQQPVRGDPPGERDQVRAAPLVADPARYAYVAVQREIGLKLALAAGEAVDDRAGQARAVPFQDLQEIAEGVPLVEERGLPKPRRDGELALEAL